MDRSDARGGTAAGNAPGAPASAAFPLRIRPCRDDDVPAITAIYGWNVVHGTGTFELEPPGEADMAQRRRAVLDAGWPWLVAENGNATTVLGYAYAAPFRPRRAYRFALEDSIYLAADAQGRGVGRLLLAELLARCEALGGRQMFAVIGDSANLASIRLHRAFGFADAGVLRSAGWKFDRWLDVVILRRALGEGDDSAPREPRAPAPASGP